MKRRWTPELPTRAALLSGLDPAYDPDASTFEPDLTVKVRRAEPPREDRQARHDRTPRPRRRDVVVTRGGLALQDWLWRHRMTQEAFGKRLGCPQSSVAALVRGASVSSWRASKVEELTGIAAGLWREVVT
jgi:hypothetical protein